MPLNKRIATIGLALILPALAAATALPVAKWRTNPAPDAGDAMAYDAARQQTVLFGTFGDTWVWDGLNWTQKFPAASPSPRSGHAMAYMGTGQQGEIVLFGGYDGHTTFGDTWIWDGSNWTQLFPATSPPARQSHAMAYDVARGQVVLFGGESFTVGNLILGDTWVWNGTNWTQKTAPPLTLAPSARVAPAMAYMTSASQVVLFGGYLDHNLADTWLWNGTQWTQVFPVSSPPARNAESMAYAGGGLVLLFGGVASDVNSPTFYGDTWAWDGTTWLPLAPAHEPPGRDYAAMAYDGVRSQVVLFGGVHYGLLGDTWEWSGADWNYRVAAPVSPNASSGQSMVYDAAHQQVFMYTGCTNCGFAFIWTWDGSQWQQPSTNAYPPGRANTALAYDAVRHLVVLFGGNDGTQNLSDTWVWDGSNWTQKISAHSPPARSGHAMTFDAAHGKVVLFGGGSDQDTWLWDGTDWTQALPSNSPSGRNSFAMTYDSAHSQVVLFGGNSSGDLGDTWVWDGANWTQKAASVNPPARSRHTLVYDAVRGQTVLFGGSSNNTALGDTWIWDGGNWTQRLPSTSPSPRWGHGMAYDINGQGMLFGGANNTTTLGETAFWDGGLLVSSNGFLYSHVSQTYNGSIVVKNPYAFGVVGPFSVVLENLPAGVGVVNPAGTYNGSAYVVANPGILQAGQSISVTVQFSGPFPTQITFGSEVYFGAHLQ